MKLVDFEDPVWATIQGEGILAGTPSVFIRLYGCDFSCEWCDTKGSWRSGSTFQEKTVEEIVQEVRAPKLNHAVITGGNPLLQIDELAELVVRLKEPYGDGNENSFQRQGMHVTVETQGSIYDEAIARHVDLLSLSPKLHQPHLGPVSDYLRERLRRNLKTQIKVVCSPNLAVGPTSRAIDTLEGLYELAVSGFGKKLVDENLHLILQPESSTGRKGVEEVQRSYMKRRLDSSPGYTYPLIRIIPQLHKTAFYVR